MASGNLQPGQVIQDTYRIVRRIGEGGMGEVYEATHARLSGRYAIKLLLRDIAGDASLIARFQREAEVTSSLRHPNIVQVLDFRQLADGTPYLVMEYLEGTDLATAIDDGGPMPLPRVAGLVDQIASGLAAAHERGIVHRDLKPANLFLVVLPGSHRELVKIVDFGISKVRTAGAQLTRTATVMGTPQYMAPEQAQGLVDDIDARSDQFSLATIAYEMIAGRCAFPGDTIPAVMYKLCHVDPPPLAVNGQPVAAAIDAVVRRGLAKRPEDRFPAVLDFARAFERAVASPDAAAAGVEALGRTELPSSVVRAPAARTTTPPAGAPPETTLGRAAGEAGEPPTKAPLPRGVRRTLAVGGAVAVLGGAALAIVFRTGGSARPARLTAPGAAPGPGPSALAATAAPPAVAPVAPELVTVEVQDPPRDLSVSIDGGEPQPLPARLPKGSGKHALTFRAPGYRSRTMELDASKDLALVLAMKRGAGAPRVESTAAARPSREGASSQSATKQKKAGRWRQGVDAASGFVKKHFGTGAQ